jgi:hypothetical protein
MILLVWHWLAAPDRPTVELPELSDLVYCAGGPLWRETPPEVAAVAPFLIGRFEVTQEEYATFLDAQPSQSAPEIASWRGGRSGPPDEWDLPITQVSYDDCDAYARWRGLRIPTSDEWEWAVRTSRGLRYPWGDGEPASLVANSLEAGIGGLTPVGLFESGRSSVGAYDLVGNAAEWTSTVSTGTFSRAHFVRGGSFLEPIRNRAFGEGASIMDTHRMRSEGGSDPFEAIPGRLSGPQGRSSDRGFRVALDWEVAQALRDIVGLIPRLGGRDPWTYWREVRPAIRRLDAMCGTTPVLVMRVWSRLADGPVKTRFRKALEAAGVLNGR